MPRPHQIVEHDRQGEVAKSKHRLFLYADLVQGLIGVTAVCQRQMRRGASHKPEHIAWLSCLSEDPLHLLPVCLDAGVQGLHGGALAHLEGQQEAVQENAVAHQLRVTGGPASQEGDRCWSGIVAEFTPLMMNLVTTMTCMQ